MKDVQRNKLEFKGQNIYVGIDVHLKSWSISGIIRTLRTKEVQSKSGYGSFATNYPGANYHSVCDSRL